MRVRVRVRVRLGFMLHDAVESGLSLSSHVAPEPVDRLC